MNNFIANIMSNIIGKKSQFDLDEMAQLLKVDKKALAEFERSYADLETHNGLSDNFFKHNRNDVKALRTLDLEPSEFITKMIDTIVDELLDDTTVYTYSNNILEKNILHVPNNNKVTSADINSLPEQIRPQLTGSLMKIDINSPSYPVLLNNLYEALSNKNKEKAQLHYGLFRQGLDILDLDPITYDIIGQNQNSIGHWFPSLIKGIEKQTFFKVPNTTYIKVPLPILQLTRLEYQSLSPTTFNIIDKFCQKAFKLNTNKSYFIKTGTYSSKFDFRNAKVSEPKEIMEIGQYLLFIHYQALQMASPLNTDSKGNSKSIYGVSTTNEWVVREFIEDDEKRPTIYHGLPLRSEFRVFIDFDKKKILDIRNYWDPTLIEERFKSGIYEEKDPHYFHDYMNFQIVKETLEKDFIDLSTILVDNLRGLIENMPLKGQWSLDILKNANDYYIIDMALAENSALNNRIKSELKPAIESWIPPQIKALS